MAQQVKERKMRRSYFFIFCYALVAIMVILQFILIAWLEIYKS